MDDKKKRTSAEIYDAKKITVLKGLEAVRKTPAMYIGDISSRGLHHLVYEVIDNSIDEAMAGFCTKIQITVHKNNSVTVQDNGRGIPVDLHPTQKRPAVEVVLTTLHAGGKFDRKSYKVSGGLHGVGVSVVNALSEWLEVSVFRNGSIYHQKYERGFPVSKLKKIGSKKETGTQIQFLPDTKVFKRVKFNYDTLLQRIRELAFLNSSVKFIFKDENTGQKDEFHYKGGLVEFVQYLETDRKPLFKNPVYFKAAKEDVDIEIAIQYDDTYAESIFTYVNNIPTIEGGTHQIGRAHV